MLVPEMHRLFSSFTAFVPCRYRVVPESVELLRVSQLLIQHYLNDLQTLRRVSGTSRESVVREAFKTLLKDWGKSRVSCQ
jgi:hypothetical protein